MIIKTIRKQVEYVLREKAYTRNSDRVLWVEVVCEFYWSQFFQFVADLRQIPDENIRTLSILQPKLQRLMSELPNQDEIKRVRARCNQQGRFIATDWKVAKARGIKESDWKLALGYSIATPGDHIEEHLQKQHLASL